jgi:fission process protein 1
MALSLRVRYCSTHCYSSLIPSLRDVAYETYKAHHRGPSPVEAANFSEPTRLTISAVQRAAFQSIASMYALLPDVGANLTAFFGRALPAFTIHTVVAQAKKAFVNTKNVKVKTWGPTVTGLALVPALPYLFDHPVEQVTDRAFDWIREKLIERNQPPSVGKDKKEL